MRARYDRHGRITGYSGGPGTYYWFQLLEIAFLFLIVIPVVILILAVAVVCVIGWGIANLFGKADAAAWWRGAASGVMDVLVHFGRWSDRGP